MKTNFNIKCSGLATNDKHRLVVVGKADFSREEAILERARKALAKAGPDESAFGELTREYEKLLRQARRLVGMGDRMQRSLADLNRELAVNEEKYRTTFERVAEGIFRTVVDGRLVEVNPAMASMFGFDSPQDMLKTVERIPDLFLCRDVACAYEHGLEERGGLRRMEAQMRVLNGKALWCEVSATPLHSGDDADACSGVVGVVADITERRKAMEDMCRLARTDALTGLWNRGYFMELARRELARSRRMERPLSLLMVDADHFKNVNDTYGHDAGDTALCMLAEILETTFREVDVVARFGGEEFVVLLPDTPRREACRAAQRLLETVRAKTIRCGDNVFSMTVSLGVTTGEGGAESMDSLLKLADIALYAAKKNGRDRLEVFRGEHRC